jgi:hypothetical protein
LGISAIGKEGRRMNTVKAIEPTTSESFLHFSQTIKTPKTRSNYIQALRYYMNFKDYDDLLKFSSTPEGLLDVQKNIIRFIGFCKQKGLSYNTIHRFTSLL